MTENPGPTSNLPPSLARRLRRIVAAPQADGEAEIETICGEYPMLADEIRRFYAVQEPGPVIATWGPLDSRHVDHPDRIGAYRILEVLGEGGMGRVYRAERREPVRQMVALKVVQPGMSTRDVLARFELERRALAAMNHRCIAKVFDAGATEKGEPYFVMELVEGRPVTQYCDKHRLSVPDRLHLLQQVCEGVQHAHLKGVVHRDLKPGNVLVVREGDTAVPKILDFGLAKATNRDFLAVTLFTERNRIIGTPEYMSPEQAAGDGEVIDARSDIYSLGVMLYELLAGGLPFPTKELRKAGALEALRLIREQDPPKPSTRLVSRHDGSSIAKQRRTSFGALKRALAGDLDWVILKAMAKEPDRRYDAATTLAADLARYLNQEPVLAGPPSTVYRLKKFLRKRSGPVLAAAGIVVALSIGLVVAVRALGERTAALADRDKALAKYRQMEDVPRAEELIGESDTELWPVHPDKVALMDAWLARARKLVGRGKDHEKVLRDIRGRALPPTEDVRAAMRELGQAVEERNEKGSQLEKAKRSKSPALKQELPKIQSEFAALQKKVDGLEQTAQAKRWQFAAFEDRFLHGVFRDLVIQIDRLRDIEIPGVETRRRQAVELQRRSIVNLAEQWRHVIDSVANNHRYAGMPTLSPQLGLVPLGPDPDSMLQEFAVLHTGTVPTRDEAGKLSFDQSSAIVLVLLPPGTFWMGAQKEDASKPNYDSMAEDDEGPIQQVTLAEFFLSKYELTQGQWLRVIGRNPSLYRAGGTFGNRPVTAANPVEYVTWEDCRQALHRFGLLLPTEAQWEYGARAGTTTPWWTGRTVDGLDKVGNLSDAYAKANGAPPTWSFEDDLDDGHGVHAPVGTYRANGFGLHDVIGNVWEWCRDWEGRYDTVAPRPGDGFRMHAGGQRRVVRGGSFADLARGVRCADRSWARPGNHNDDIGVRPSRVIER